ncbi:hypothetical protein PVIIG_05462 [Plasmodium vivax India VII]|uniref:Uncharacterized protein n=1 Tax=Plasmodium vivax India VII TaxID=1077284 RepID=A0A0J9UT70_PLAVI|nr:hypothetical protein PVIIG_05462 [Plasmodium vivax India VII]
MALSPENNWVEVLQNLPSYKEYEKLDKVDITNEKSTHCNNLGSKDEGDKTLCKKIVQNLNQLSALKDDENLENSCYYFQHWFFDNIAKKYYDGDERAAESEREKLAAAKPVEVKPKETVSEEESAEREEAEEEANEDETAEGITVEEVTTEEVVSEMTSNMQHEEDLGSHPIESAEEGVRAISSHNTEPASNTLPLTIADSTNTLGTAHEELDSNFFRNVIMAIAVLGTIFFLFYYNRVIAHSIL